MRKVIAISLSFILLLSNVGLTLASHYCGGEAVESQLMIGEKSLDCEMPDMDATCENDGAANMVRPIPCCENHYTTLSLKDGFTTTGLITAPNAIFIQALVATFIGFSFARESLRDDFFTYLPPVAWPDISILFQVFRL
ncbi:hypothetical protein G3O08_15330 [Cryomorpha ignava]|uniref:Uncharacterized protein n=1 Tax=Cryomorpha ignava TaxID=101383 RepID=A0A7K3WTQ5_9FLAO|nr:hypothetical protein [Cryomorpha ignava]NEN24874.1 hypothetical protein [Cryomorpha ignava]